MKLTRKYYMACGLLCNHTFSLWARSDDEAIYRARTDGLPFFHGVDRVVKADDPPPVIVRMGDS